MADKVLTEGLSEPLNGATTAKVAINCGPGHLTIDRLTGGQQLLASGDLQYFEKQGPPTRTLDLTNGQANLTLVGGGKPRASLFRFAWSAGGGAFEWLVHMNPTVPSDITAHSEGGNVKLNLAGMAVSSVSAETRGGNMDVILPDGAADLNATAKTSGGKIAVDVGSGITGENTLNADSGAGSVVVRVPSGLAARIYATSGMGKVMVDPQFGKVDGKTYQSPDYDSAINRIEITARSGAGNVSISTK